MVKISAFQAGNPGSIPGQCIYYPVYQYMAKIERGPPNSLNNKNLQNQFEFFNKRIEDIKEQQRLTDSLLPRLRNRLEGLMAIPTNQLTNNQEDEIHRIRETIRAMKINSLETEMMMRRIVELHKKLKNNYF